MNKSSFIVCLQNFLLPTKASQLFSTMHPSAASCHENEWITPVLHPFVIDQHPHQGKDLQTQPRVFLSYFCLTNGRILHLNDVGKKIVPNLKTTFFLWNLPSLKINGWKTAYVLRRPIFRRELLCLGRVITYEPGIIAKTSLGTDLKMHLFHR